MEFPQTLHGQLFLLAFDRRRHRFDGDNRWRFGLALRAAMLTDLYLTGHLREEDDRPQPVDVARPDDPVLRAVLDEIEENPRRSWAQAMGHGQREAPRLVGSQLKAIGWVTEQRCRSLGVVPCTRLRLQDERLVGVLALQVATALRAAIGGEAADERLLAVGLLGALGQLPTVFSLEEAARHQFELWHLVDRGAPPIVGMREVIETVQSEMTAHTAFHSRGP